MSCLLSKYAERFGQQGVYMEGCRVTASHWFYGGIAVGFAESDVQHLTGAANPLCTSQHIYMIGPRAGRFVDEDCRNLNHSPALVLLRTSILNSVVELSLNMYLNR